ncbi:hypothetical protein NX059_009982 [Plenodomus lindquistii]|nr:hypothetical protein NX059_009982 [Plenodomus lindquistii]
MSSSAADDIEVSSISTSTRSRSMSSAYPDQNASLYPSQKSASQTLLEEPPRPPHSLMKEGSSADIDALAEHLTVQEATRLTGPVPPFLHTPWAHDLNWKMPCRDVLANVFPPVLVDAIQRAHREGSTRCFCSLVLTTAQELLRTFSNINILRDCPRDLAECLAVMNQLMRPIGVKVFTIDCDRTEKLHGRAQLEQWISEGTYAEHMSEFIEQLPRFGFGAYGAAEEQFAAEAEQAKKINRMKKNVKSKVKRVCDRFRSERGHAQGYSKLVEPKQEQQDGRMRRG